MCLIKVRAELNPWTGLDKPGTDHILTYWPASCRELWSVRSWTPLSRPNSSERILGTTSPIIPTSAIPLQKLSVSSRGHKHSIAFITSFMYGTHEWCLMVSTDYMTFWMFYLLCLPEMSFVSLFSEASMVAGLHSTVPITSSFFSSTVAIWHPLPTETCPAGHTQYVLL